MSMSVRYFFHLVSDLEVIPDEQGIELLVGNGLLARIARAVEELIREIEPSADWHGWWFEITDEAGRIVLRIPLRVVGYRH
jgi:hypothetical protein